MKYLCSMRKGGIKAKAYTYCFRDTISRKAQKSVVQDSLFTEETLATYLTEIGCLINRRPLIPISDNVNNMEALTPNYFLLRRSNASFKTPILQNNISNFCTKSKFIQDILSVFWKQWIAEFHPLLKQRNKWNMNTVEFL